MSALVVFAVIAIILGLVIAGAFVWGHKHGVDTAALAAVKASAGKAITSEVKGATDAVTKALGG